MPRGRRNLNQAGVGIEGSGTVVQPVTRKRRRRQPSRSGAAGGTGATATTTAGSSELDLFCAAQAGEMRQYASDHGLTWNAVHTRFATIANKITRV